MEGTSNGGVDAELLFRGDRASVGEDENSDGADGGKGSTAI